ncbi:hypothetical protein PGUG_00941 [Meyerozyma guilliermondii ATCC 6260]|uniref:Mid2 domain-containing protein n=1 Tax=Meyerozyma guilliermondii (strain ATCC 6260 / CBS 566 / DSM 6381 / JCM 1539 / NBRC 10279 / NRRL Y-324) TaxID=294746 RepID=A5DCD6_PICGU|nr:uncharacterized protein PGUG_00941 [Meyerozyma guilliermondii ATCC 6260]EDK36843.2 hypothetical protein PGUG_00941 [Meyerozyma guilliermondii ATCC 6260]
MSCRSLSWVLLLIAVACSLIYVTTLHSDTPGIEKITKGNFRQWSFQFIDGKTGYESRPKDEQTASEVRAVPEETVVVMARADNDTSVFVSSDEFGTFTISSESTTFSDDPTTSSFVFSTSSSSSSSFAQRTSSRVISSSSSSNTQPTSSSQRTTTRQEASSSKETPASETQQDSTTSSPETTSSSSQSDQITTTFSSVDNGRTVVVTRTIDSERTNQPSAASGDRGNSSGSSGLSNTNKIVVGVVVGVGGAIIIGIISILFLLKRRTNKDQEGGWTFWRKNEKGDDSDLLSGELGVRDRNINQGSNF